MKPIANALGISRSHLVTSIRDVSSKDCDSSKEPSLSDKNLIEEVRNIVGERPSYGYRRACAVLNKKHAQIAGNRVNHKRIYRVMKNSGLFLPKHLGLKLNRKHEGKVMTMKSNTR